MRVFITIILSLTTAMGYASRGFIADNTPVRSKRGPASVNDPYHFNVRSHLKMQVKKLKEAQSAQAGIRMVGDTRPEQQIEAVLKHLAKKKAKAVQVTGAMFFHNKVHVKFGADTVILEVVDLNRGLFKVDNREVTILPTMTFMQVYQNLARVMGAKNAGIPFLLPQAHAGFFSTLFKVAAIGVIGISVVDVFYYNTHSKNKEAISTSASTCKGYLQLQEQGQAPPSTPTTTKQLDHLIMAFNEVKRAQCGGGFSYVLRVSLVKAIKGACGDAEEAVKCLEKYSDNRADIDPGMISLMTQRLRDVKPVWTNNDESNSRFYYKDKARAIERMGSQ